MTKDHLLLIIYSLNEYKRFWKWTNKKMRVFSLIYQKTGSKRLF